GLLVLDAPGAVLVVLRTARWCPPPSPLVKANFNTTYIEGSHSYCSEVVVRDAQGQVLVSWNRIHGQVSSAFAAEALALLSVDSLHVIRKLNNVQVDRSEIRALITKGRLQLHTFSAVATVCQCFQE
ncbi:hypothetical protein ES319_A03G079900v1, partial [Gossypium barbadense]